MPAPEVPQGHDTLRFSDPQALAGLLRGEGLGGVVVAPHRTTYPMPDAEALWRAGMGGMAVTAAAIAAQDTATQARAREALARRSEVYRGPRGLEIPIAFPVGTGQKR